MSQTEIGRKVVILGSGPAGLTAAIYASRAQLEPLVIDGPQPGGQLTITTDVENYPGFSKGIMGPEMMNEFRAQATRFGTEIINVWIDRVDLSQRPFTRLRQSERRRQEITTVIKAELIVSTGAPPNARRSGRRTRAVGLGGTAFRRARPATDSFFRGKDVVIVGGGDTAMEEAMFLTRFRFKSTADAPPRLVPRFKDYAGARFSTTTKYDVCGTRASAKSRHQRRRRHGRQNLQHPINEESDFPTQGVFVAIGHKPNTDLFKGILDMDETGT
jgi:thioredoxin reductase (NADPH)